MRDPLSKSARSALMAKISSRGNKSTEGVVERTFVHERIKGWVKHPPTIAGRPDFYFPAHKLAIFVDGCFWHKCPTCRRRIPAKRRTFWLQKIRQNHRRDERIRRRLRIQGFHAMRIWEHQLRTKSWLNRIKAFLRSKTGKY